MIHSPLQRARVAAAAVLLAAWSLAACGHVVLISRYDEATDAGITALHGKLDALLTRLDAEPTPAYEATAPDYAAIRSDLAALRLRNEARPKNELTVRQLDELRATLAIFEEQHRKGTLNRAMIAPSRDALERACRAVLTLELAKKELDE